jgi:hypothetical protein
VLEPENSFLEREEKFRAFRAGLIWVIRRGRTVLIRVEYWEIIADRLSADGWSWGMTTAIDVYARKLFIVDAHRSDTHGRFIVQSDELLTAFLELESAIWRRYSWFKSKRGSPSTRNTS